MNETRADATLVAAHLAGDRSALAGIYDRYADSLYDTAAAMLSDRHEAADVMQDVFLIAAERLGQLQDQTRLKPWLFAILRNQVFTRTKRRSRTRVTDFSAAEAPEMVAPIDPLAEGETAAYTELAELMRSAAAGLDERDQLVLEYSIRQDLTGADLAAALGVSLDQSYVLVHRMRDRVERGIGALTVARMGRKDCPDLGDVLAGWDGTFSVLIRKRVARHVEQCDVCTATKRKFAVLPMMGAAPALAAPAALRDTVLARAALQTAAPAHSYGFGAAGGFPSPVGSGRRSMGLVAAAIAAVVLLVGGGLAFGITRGGGSSPRAVTVATKPAPALASTAPTSPGTVADASEPATTTPPTTIPATTIPATTIPATTTPETTTPETTIPSTTLVPTTVPAAPPAVTGAPAVAPTTAPPPTAPSTTAPSTTAPSTTAPPTTLPPPGQLQISSFVVDLGAAATSSGVSLANTGGQTISWSLDASQVAPFSTSATGGSLPPGGSVQIPFVLDRVTAPEGNLSRTVAVTSSAAGGGNIEVRAIVERPPAVAITQAAPNPTCPQIAVPTIRASVSDESPIVAVTLRWSGPGSPGSAAMTSSGGSWAASLGVPYVEGPWNYSVTATDARGNVSTVSATTTVLCPTPG